jgi:hypothetical protein
MFSKRKTCLIMKDFTDLAVKLYANHDVVLEGKVYWIIEKATKRKLCGVNAISKMEALYCMIPGLVFDRNNFISNAVF